ncbi:MAG: hypothetical protein MJ090_02675 [Clostridia bacterium]|nr:hypothetical protein [Clostridia bacterium]
MKKVLSLILALFFVLSVCSCSVKKTENENNKENNISADEAVDSKPDYQAFVGNYQDKVSQRSTATVTENPDLNSCHIEVLWGNSATETEKWVMDAVWQDEKLSYTNCKNGTVTTDENGNETYKAKYENGKGFFDFDGKTGNLSWVGAEDEQCKECVFVKIEDNRITLPVAKELFDRNLKCTLNIFDLDTLSYEKTPLSGTWHRVTDSRFSTFAELEEYVKATYIEETAQIFFDRKLYKDIDGKLSIDTSRIGGKGYYVDWTDYIIEINKSDNETAEFSVTATIEEPSDNPKKEEYKKTVTALRVGETWLLEKIVY